MDRYIKILGNKINCFETYSQLYEVLLQKLRLDERGTGYITVNNVHTIIEGFRNSKYSEIINQSLFAIPDGKPLQIVGRLKGNKEITRLFGPSVMEKFIDWGRKDDVKHFFFGGSEEKLNALKFVIEAKYPGAKIAGAIAPPFRPMNEWQNQEFIQIINEVKPDFIWIGLGAPKQEKWMYEHHKSIQTGLMFGIGAGFDYLAGNTKHAPEWMKRFALEWLYRLAQEPKRLWKRYLKTIPQFLFFASLELIGVKLRNKQ